MGSKYISEKVAGGCIEIYDRPLENDNYLTEFNEFDIDCLDFVQA